MNNKRGSILAIVIIFIFIFTLLGMFAMRLVILQNETSDSELYYTRAHFAALYGSELALHRIMQWESIATTTDTSKINPLGRKFLSESNDCFNYINGKWYPLEGFTIPEENFSDEITGGSGSGIHIECLVEEDLNPNINDGKLPDMNPSSLDQKYGTYKFYVIKTTATIYSNLAAKTGEISSAKDYLYFMIAYSSGTAGARSSGNIIEADGTLVRGFRYLPEGRQLLVSLGYNTVAMGVPSDSQILSNPSVNDNLSAEHRGILDSATLHFTSPPNRSLVTGKVLPIFRYYIRGRR